MKKSAKRPVGQFNRILVPVDFSEPSRDALRQARALAGDDLSRLRVLHVAEPLHVDWHADASALQMQAQEAARHALATLVQAEFGEQRPEARMIRGRAADGIVKYAIRMNADLIVLGTHGRSGIRRALLGSVAENVVRHAPCPVLVVR
jgi:universal stress protein A